MGGRKSARLAACDIAPKPGRNRGQPKAKPKAKPKRVAMGQPSSKEDKAQLKAELDNTIKHNIKTFSNKSVKEDFPDVDHNIIKEAKDATVAAMQWIKEDHTEAEIKAKTEELIKLRHNICDKQMAALGATEVATIQAPKQFMTTCVHMMPPPEDKGKGKGKGKPNDPDTLNTNVFDNLDMQALTEAMGGKGKGPGAFMATTANNKGCGRKCLCTTQKH